jgi:outer membrane protein assembly factor BamB
MRVAVALLVVGVVASAGRADDPAERSPLPGEVRNTAKRIAEADRKPADEAADEYQRILDEAGDDLVPIDERRSLQARWLCQRRLAALPPAARQRYRQRVEAQARRWLQEGLARRDPALLERVVEEAFCSRAAEEALDRLGDLAFERGDYERARAYWRTLARPAGSPPGDADLTYPDPTADVALVQAKELLARLFLGDRAGAAEELQQFRAAHPDVAGLLAGQRGRYADRLAALFAGETTQPAAAVRRDDWPTLAGDPTRNAVRSDADLPRYWPNAPTWTAPLPADPRRPAGLPPPLSVGDDSPRALAFHPVIVGGHVLVADARRVTAYDLTTGKLAAQFDLAQLSGEVVAGLDLSLPPRTETRYSLTAADGRIWARLGAQVLRAPPAQRPGEGETVLVGLELRHDPATGQTRFAAGPALRPYAADPRPGEPWPMFEGAPAVRDGRVYVGVSVLDGGRATFAVDCYDARGDLAHPPVRLWRQEVAELPPAPPDEPRRRHLVLTLAGPNVVACPHAGAVVALDARSGKRVWAVRYPSRGRTPLPSPREPADCLAAGGQVFAAPADCDHVLALDALTGAIRWESSAIEVVHLLGVVQGKLVVTTAGSPSFPESGTARGLRALDAATGDAGRGWVQAVDGAPPTYGRGFLTEDLVFWPTKTGLRLVRCADGLPHELQPVVGPCDRPVWGNLALGHHCLAVATPTELRVYVPPARMQVTATHQGQGADGPRSLGLPIRGLTAPARPDPDGPLRRAGEVVLPPGQRFLASIPGADTADWLFASAGATVAAHRLSVAGPAWTQTLAFAPTASVVAADSVLLAGPHGVSRRQLSDGGSLWEFVPPADPTDRAAHRLFLPASGEGELSAFHLAGETLFALFDRRKLLALDRDTGRVLWQHDAPPLAWPDHAADGPVAPGFLVGPATVLLYVAPGRRRLLDRRTGRLIAESAVGPQRPDATNVALLDNDTAAVAESPESVTRIDLTTGRTLWRWPVPRRSSLSGELPQLRADGDALWVRVGRNSGDELERLDPRSGRSAWPESAFLGPEPVDLSDAATDGTALYLPGRSALIALARDDGRRLWELPLTAPGPAPGWRVLRLGGLLAVAPRQAVPPPPEPPGRYRRGWLPVYHGPDPLWYGVVLADPRTGRAVQRLTFTTPGPAASLRSAGRHLAVVLDDRASAWQGTPTER